MTSSLPQTHSASISFFVGAGSRYESDETAGVSHFLEHMLFKGTERRPTPREVSEEIEGVVVSLVHRSPHSFIHVKAPDQHKQMRVWAVECGSAEQFRRNVLDGALKPGDDIVVTGDVGRDEGLWRLRLRSVVRPRDGWRWKEWLR